VVYISIFEECLVVVLSGWQSNWFCCFLCEIVKKCEGVGRKGLIELSLFLVLSEASREITIASVRQECKVHVCNLASKYLS